MVVEILCVVQCRKAEHTWAYVSIYDASKVQNLPAKTIFITKYCCCQQRISKGYRPAVLEPKSQPTPCAQDA